MASNSILHEDATPCFLCQCFTLNLKPLVAALCICQPEYFLACFVISEYSCYCSSTLKIQSLLLKGGAIWSRQHFRGIMDGTYGVMDHSLSSLVIGLLPTGQFKGSYPISEIFKILLGLVQFNLSLTRYYNEDSLNTPVLHLFYLLASP